MNEKTLSPISLYIHFPWCVRKCPYCDFNSHEARNGIPENRYIDALLSDLSIDLALLPRPSELSSIFMGGGTPSLFSPEALQRLLVGVKRLMILSDQCEITLEANPGAVESYKFQEFRSLGINRLSIGAQSFNDKHLSKLGRIHSAKEAAHAFENAEHAGFNNINLDLMFGLPDQTKQEAIKDVRTTLSLKPAHISFYQLTLEPNTYFHKFPPRLPREESIISMQSSCQQLLAESGYIQYEISAYARNGRQCRHNLNYWRFGDYLGIGAGAHGKISRTRPANIIRTIKPKHPDHYLTGLWESSPETIQLAELPLEFVMNHLRLTDGFNLEFYTSATGLGRESLDPGLARCLALELLLERDGRIFCSETGWNFLDNILEKFVP